MTGSRVLIDTDVLSALMRKHPAVLSAAKNYLLSEPRLSISAITRYEILRGLHAKNASSQLVAFDTFCQSIEILPLTDDAIVRAAEVYGTLRQAGQLIGDADILIACTCMKAGYDLATNNVGHFSRIKGLHLVNWTS